MAKQFTIPFKSFYDTDCTIDIYVDGYSGDVEELKAGIMPFVVENSRSSVVSGANGLVETFFKINAISSSDLNNTALQSEEYGDIWFEYFEGATLKYKGVVSPFETGSPYEGDGYYTLGIGAEIGLNELKSKELRNADGSILESRIRLIDVVALALKSLTLPNQFNIKSFVSIQTFTGTTEVGADTDFFSRYVDAETFKIGLNEWMSCYEALETVLSGKFDLYFDEECWVLDYPLNSLASTRNVAVYDADGVFDARTNVSISKPVVDNTKVKRGGNEGRMFSKKNIKIDHKINSIINKITNPNFEFSGFDILNWTSTVGSLEIGGYGTQAEPFYAKIGGSVYSKTTPTDTEYLESTPFDWYPVGRSDFADRELSTYYDEDEKLSFNIKGEYGSGINGARIQIIATYEKIRPNQPQSTINDPTPTIIYDSRTIYYTNEGWSSEPAWYITGRGAIEEIQVQPPPLRFTSTLSYKALPYVRYDVPTPTAVSVKLRLFRGDRKKIGEATTEVGGYTYFSKFLSASASTWLLSDENKLKGGQYEYVTAKKTDRDSGVTIPISMYEKVSPFAFGSIYVSDVATTPIDGFKRLGESTVLGWLDFVASDFLRANDVRLINLVLPFMDTFYPSQLFVYEGRLFRVYDFEKDVAMDSTRVTLHEVRYSSSAVSLKISDREFTEVLKEARPTRYQDLTTDDNIYNKGGRIGLNDRIDALSQINAEGEGLVFGDAIKSNAGILYLQKEGVEGTNGIYWVDNLNENTDYIRPKTDGFVFKSETSPYEVTLDFTELTANTRLIIPPLSGDSSLVTTETGWLLNGNALTASKSIGSTTDFDIPIIRNNVTVAAINTKGMSFPLIEEGVLFEGARDFVLAGIDLADTTKQLIKVTASQAVDFLSPNFWKKGGNVLSADDTIGSTTDFDVSVIRNSVTKALFGATTTDFDAATYNFKNGDTTYATLNSTGLGIGITAPSANLQVRRDSADILPSVIVENVHANGFTGLQINRSGVARFAFTQYATAGTNDWFTGTAYNGGGGNSAYSIGTGIDLIDAKVTVLSSGNVGIGTTSPSAKLTILQSSDVASQGIYLYRANGSDWTGFYKKSGLGSLNDPLVLSTNYKDDIFAIDRIGNVYIDGKLGIGTNNHTNSVSVDVENAYSLGVFRKLNVESVGDAATVFSMGAYASSVAKSGVEFYGILKADANNGSFRIRTLQSGSMVDDFTVNGGNVGIGTTSPSYKLDVTGTGHFTGSVTFDTVPSSLQDATSANHLVRYSQWIASTSIKYLPTPVLTVSLTNVTLLGVQTINGVTLIAGDRVLVMGQTVQADNGIYIVAAGVWVRATDSDSDTELRVYIINVSSGTYAGYKYINTNESTITVGTTAITYAEFSGIAEIDPVFVSWRDTTRTANTFWAAPTGSNGAATWRALVAADVPTLNQSTTGSAATLTTPRTIALSGDATWSVSFNGSADVTSALTLATVNSNVGTYVGLTVNAKGLVTAATALTTLSGYGITDAQPIDATLTALAALDTTAGVVIQTGTDTFTKRTLTGTTNRLTLTNGTAVSANPTFDISSSYVGQSTITTLGTVTTGTWNAGVIPILYGGTGSATQNFVDLTTTQASISGNKTFLGITSFGSRGGSIQSFNATGGADGGTIFFGGSHSVTRATTYNRFQIGSNDRAILTHVGLRLKQYAGDDEWYNVATEMLHVDGNIRYTGTLKPSNSAGTSGQFLMTSVTANAWTTLTTSHISDLSSYTGFDTRYFTETESDTRFVALGGSYANPTWITELAWSKLSGVPSTFTPSAHTLDSHSNVTITSNSSGEILKWNGSAWINNTPDEADLVDKTNTQTIGGTKTFSKTITAGTTATVTLGNIGFFAGIANSGSATGTIVRGTTYNKLQVGTSDRLVVYDAGVRISAFGTSYTTAPTERLQVEGNIRYNTLLKPNNVAGTNKQVLSTSGTQDIWSTLNFTYLSDVDITSLTGGDILMYDNTTSKWRNQNPSIALLLQIDNISGLQTALDDKQPLDADLTAIAALTGTSGLLRKTNTNTWTLDTTTYLTTTTADSLYQSILPSGDSGQFLVRDSTGEVNFMDLKIRPIGLSFERIGVGNTDNYLGEHPYFLLKDKRHLQISRITDSTKQFNAGMFKKSNHGFIEQVGGSLTIRATSGIYLTDLAAPNRLLSMVTIDSFGRLSVGSIQGGGSVQASLTTNQVGYGVNNTLSGSSNLTYLSDRYFHFTNSSSNFNIGVDGMEGFAESINGNLKLQARGDYGVVVDDGYFKVNDLAGSGTRMVVASSTGVLSTQTIPSGGGVPALNATQIAFGNGSNLMTSSSNFVYDNGTLVLTNTTLANTNVIRINGSDGYDKNIFFSEVGLTDNGAYVGYRGGVNNNPDPTMLVLQTINSGNTMGGIAIHRQNGHVYIGLSPNSKAWNSTELNYNKLFVDGNMRVGGDEIILAGTVFKLSLGDSFTGAYTPSNGDKCTLTYDSSKAAFVLQKMNTRLASALDGSETFLIL